MSTPGVEVYARGAAFPGLRYGEKAYPGIVGNRPERGVRGHHQQPTSSAPPALQGAWRAGEGASWALRGCEHPRPVWGSPSSRSPPPPRPPVSGSRLSVPPHLSGFSVLPSLPVSESLTPPSHSLHAWVWSSFLCQSWVSLPAFLFAISVCFPGSLVSTLSAFLSVPPSPHGSSCRSPSSLISISISRHLLPVPLSFLPSSSPWLTLPPTHLCLRPWPGETPRKKIPHPPPHRLTEWLAREARSPPNSAPSSAELPHPILPSWHPPIPP